MSSLDYIPAELFLDLKAATYINNIYFVDIYIS